MRVLDPASLGRAVRVEVPSCSAAMLVGSAVARRGGAVADLDVTGLDATVAVGDDRALVFTWRRWPVHVVCYHPLHFAAVASASELLFVFMREIRKLQDGIVLFDDDGDLARTLEQLESVSPPHHLLEPLVGAVADFQAGETDLTRLRLGLYHAVENLTYAWMHFDLRSRYSKPKWLLDDARLVPSRHLVALLRRISLELVSAHPLAELAAAIRPHAASADGGRVAMLARSNFEDAELLLRDCRMLEATWPLRMTGYMLAQSWAERLSLPYADLRSLADVRSRLADAGHPLADVLQDLLLLNATIGKDLLVRWEATRQEFLEAWREIQQSDRVRTSA